MAQQNEPLVQPEELDMPDDEVLYELADLFRVFGDSTRIKILYALHDNELCVQDIANAVQLSQSAVSHQLRVLKDSKLVRFPAGGQDRVLRTGRRPCAQHPLSGDGPYRRMIFRGPHGKNRKAGIYDEKDLQDRSGLRKLRPEDGGRCQHRCRCGKGNCQLHDPEDEGGVCRGVPTPTPPWRMCCPPARRWRTTARSLTSDLFRSGSRHRCRAAALPCGRAFFPLPPGSGKLLFRGKTGSFQHFPRTFQHPSRKTPKETWKSKFSAGKSRGKHGGKGGKSIFVGKTC